MNLGQPVLDRAEVSRLFVDVFRVAKRVLPLLSKNGKAILQNCRQQRRYSLELFAVCHFANSTGKAVA